MNGIQRILFLCAAGWLLACGQALGADGGIARKDSALMKAPYRDAQAAGTLAKGAKVDILEKRGGWYRVKSGKLDGWVRMLSIRRGQPRKGSGGNELAALASGRAGTGRVVSTTGIRGLDEEELKSARFDEAQLVKLEAQAVSRTEAAKFALQGNLKAQALE